MNSVIRKGYKKRTHANSDSFLIKENGDIKALSVIASNIDAIPKILNVLNDILVSNQLIQEEYLKMRDLVMKGDDYWMDAEEARIYVKACKNTFNKYRYNFNPRLIGSPVGGKTLYKKSDIDHWVRTYECKSADLSSCVPVV